MRSTLTTFNQYCKRGLLLRACDGKYYQNFWHDAYGRLTSENFSDIAKTEIAYRYDGANRLIGYSFDGEQVNYTYAPNTGLLNGVHYDGWEFLYSRISNSNQLFQTIAKLNGNTVNTATQTYNNFGDLTAVGDYSYTLDADAKRLGATLPDGKSWEYSYDGLNQVTGGILSNNGATVSSHAYTYDTIGNRLTANDSGNAKQYTTNNLNQYTAINDMALTYDADGNMLSDGEFTYIYDALNQLISVENTTAKQVFVYDFMGRRIVTERYSKNGEEWQQVSRIRYIYQNWNVIAEYENGTKSKIYVWGEDLSGSLQGAGGVGGLLLERSNGDYLPTYDGNGNIIAYKNSEGNIVATYSYDPFGNIIEQTGLDFSYKFSTKSLDDLSGLYYYGYRFYHSMLGRWINRDPIGEIDISNLYCSFFNLPNNCVDILGLDYAATMMQYRYDIIKHQQLRNPQKEYDSWYEKEYNEIYDKNGNIKPDSWVAEIIKENKKCPPKINVNTGCPTKPNANQSYNPSDWNDPTPLNTQRFHPRGYFEMRSKRTKGGHANQCIYSKDGNLMHDMNTHGAAPGTADKAALEKGYFRISHLREDLNPFIDAARLDGNNLSLLSGKITNVGSNIKKYYKVRPIIR